MKRILSFIIALVMVLSLFPAMVFTSMAEDGLPMGTLLVRTDGIDQTWRSATAGTTVSFLGENGVDAGNQTKPDGVYSTTNANFGSRGGKTWMKSNNIWAYGYAIEVKGAEGPVVAKIHSVTWTEDENHVGAWIQDGTPGDHTITIPGNGVYPLLLNGSAVRSGAVTDNRWMISWAGAFDVTFDKDVEYRILSEVEVAGTFTDMSTIKADVPYTYVDVNGETVETAVNVAKGYGDDGRGNGKYTATAIVPEALASVENGNQKSIFTGWTTNELSVNAEDVSLLSTKGLIDTPLYSLWKTMANVAEPALGDYYYDIKGTPVRVPTVAEGLNGVTLWEGDVDFGETGAGIVTFVIKATGIDSPVSLTRFLPTYTMQNSINTWAIDNTWGGGNTGLDGEGTEHSLALNIPKDGTYVISIGRKVFGMDGGGRVLTVSKLRVADINNSYKGTYPLANDNANAQLSLLSISAGNPTFTAYFYDEDGTKLGVATKEYPKAQEANDSQTTKKTTCLTVDDMFALTGAELPAKASDGTYNYMLQWVDGEGNPVDAVYKNMNVYASYVPVLASQAIVTFLDAKGGVIQSGAVDKGTTPVCADPAKDSTDDVTYTFAGWSVDGEIVDLASYVVSEDVTFTPVFAEDVITKASLVEIAPVQFGGSGTYGIKLNRTDVTLDVVGGVKAPISEGVVTVVTTGLTNDGKTEFTVSFDAVDENGLTNAEFTLDAVENVSASYTVKLSGTVKTEALDVASIKETSASVAVVGQQVGEFYGEGEGTPINKNKEDGSKPDRQVLWKGSVATGGTDGVTFVYKLEGVETPINASNLNIIFNGSTWAWNSWNWQNGGNTGGMVGAKQIFEENGYYYMYVNRTPNGGFSYNTVNEFVIFQNPNDKEGPNRDNANANATFKMLAVVADNLQPSLIFCDEDGKEVAKNTYKYTDLSGSIGSSSSKSEGELITIGDILAMSNVEAPVKASDDEYTYVFDKWVLADGSEINENEPFYMNVELKATYTAKAKTTKYDVTFESDGEAVETQSVWEDECASAPAAPTKAEDATGYFTFEGWSLDGKNVVDVATVAITANTTFKAVYSHTDVEFTVTYISGKNDKDEDIKFATETVIRSQDAILSGTPKYATDPYTVNEEGEVQDGYYHRFVKWVDAEGNAADLTNIQANLTVYADVEAVLVENWYKVTWQEEDGTVLDVKYVAEGDGTSTGAKSTKNGTADETNWYKHSGWDKTTAEVSSDMVVLPTYSTTPVETGVMQAYKTESVSGKVGELHELWKDKVTLDKLYKSVTAMVKITGASVDNPISLGDVYAEANGNNSNNCWFMIAANNNGSLLTNITEDGWYYITFGHNVVSNAAWTDGQYSIGTMEYLAFDCSKDIRCPSSVDASGEATYEAYAFMGEYQPTVRYYDADKTWISTNKLSYSYDHSTVNKGAVLKANDLYNGKDLGDNFLYWADIDGNEVTLITENMDLYAVYDTPAYTLGDVNNDGKVNGDDVSDLSRYVAGWPGAVLESEPAADVNGDGKVNGDDVSDLSRYVAGWPGANLGADA